MQETFHLDKARLASNMPRIKEWMVSHFIKLGDIMRAVNEKNVKENIDDSLSNINLDLYSIAGIIAKGQSVLVGDIGSSTNGYIRRYFDYLQEDLKVQNKNSLMTPDRANLMDRKVISAL